MNNLKQTFGHSMDIFTAPHVYDTSPTMLRGVAFDQQFNGFVVAMVNATRDVVIHIHPLSILWCALAQFGLLKGMLPKSVKLAKIAMIHLKLFTYIYSSTYPYISIYIYIT